MGNLKNLEVFHISSYNLEDIPLEIFDIPSLRDIRMNQSLIDKIPLHIIRKIKEKKIKIRN